MRPLPLAVTHLLNEGPAETTHRVTKVGATAWSKPTFESFPLNHALGHNPLGAKDILPRFLMGS